MKALLRKALLQNAQQVPKLSCLCSLQGLSQLLPSVQQGEVTSDWRLSTVENAEVCQLHC